MESAIKITNLSKKYHLGQKQSYYTLRDSLSSISKIPQQFLGKWGGGGAHLGEDEFWALRDITFEVQPGEVIGIIGKNGAGKSTLLKILSQITPPTTGEIRLRGRVASLLEVGTGFSQELTGRENIFLNGAILGMSQREIKSQFDAIVNFAEIEKFLDTPVKHYSSGMYMRLAFAIAAHLQPEILFVDEVLAVGDVAFQKKCLAKMGEVSQAGRTVIFVSHNMSAITSLCSRTLLLDQGRIKLLGPTPKVVAEYLELNQLTKQKVIRADVKFPKDKLKKMQIREILIKDNNNRINGLLPINTDFKIEVLFDVNQPVEGVVTTMILSSPEHLRFLDSLDIDFNSALFGKKQRGSYKTTILIPGYLNANTYFPMVVFESGQQTFDKQEGPKFKIIDNLPRPYGIAGRAPFMAKLSWATEKFR